MKIIKQLQLVTSLFIISLAGNVYAANAPAPCSSVSPKSTFQNSCSNCGLYFDAYNNCALKCDNCRNDDPTGPGVNNPSIRLSGSGGCTSKVKDVPNLIIANNGGTLTCTLDKHPEQH